VLHSHDPIPVLPRVGKRFCESVCYGVGGQVTGEGAPKPGFDPEHEELEFAKVGHVRYTPYNRGPMDPRHTQLTKRRIVADAIARFEAPPREPMVDVHTIVS
jgi:hypothetical protein